MKPGSEKDVLTRTVHRDTIKYWRVDTLLATPYISTKTGWGGTLEQNGFEKES